MYFVVEIVARVSGGVSETYLRIFQEKEAAEECYMEAGRQSDWYAIPPVEVHEITFN